MTCFEVGTVDLMFLMKDLIQWNLSKADTIGAKKFVRFRQMSAL